MCSVDAYNKQHVPMGYGAISGGVRIMSSMSSKEALISIGHTIKFIDNFFQCFEVNYYNGINIHKINMSGLFKTIPKSLPKKQYDDYKKNIRQLSSQ